MDFPPDGIAMDIGFAERVGELRWRGIFGLSRSVWQKTFSTTGLIM
jgi:hypothetical protein